MKRFALRLVHLVLTVALPAAAGQAASDPPLPLANLLKDKLLILRGFYRSERLEFDPDGRALPGGKPGFGPSDGLFHVASIDYLPGKVVIDGDLPVVYYHLDTNSVSYAQGLVKRSITIDVPDSSDPKAVEHAIWSVFYRPGEATTPSCTAEEKADFQARIRELDSAAKKSRKPPETLNPYPPNGLCLPLGEHVFYHPGKREGITAPHAIDDPDPPFPGDVPRGAFDGVVQLAAVVDESGDLSAITIIKGLGHSFDQVTAAKVRTWRMQPALLNGKPVPVFVTIETRFQRH